MTPIGPVGDVTGARATTFARESAVREFAAIVMLLGQERTPERLRDLFRETMYQINDDLGDVVADYFLAAAKCPDPLSAFDTVIGGSAGPTSEMTP